MAGVLADYRSAGLGRTLKVLQRERTLAMGLDLIEWTYDPLQAMNAPPQLRQARRHRRGVHREHLRHVEQPAAPGEPDGSVRGGVVDSEAARRAAAGRRRSADAADERGRRRAEDQSDGASRRVARIGRRRPVDRRAADAGGNSDGVHQMLAGAPELALAWRICTRAIFTTYFDRGYKAVDFFLDREARRGRTCWRVRIKN